MTNVHRAQLLYFSHGGGPLPLLGDAGHANMIAFMRELPEKLHTPEKILVISAHWEESNPTLLGSPQPAMFYDYYGFPAETYTVRYPAPGDPELAERVSGLLREQGFSPQLNTQRGFDHGLFIPLMLMYPEAQIPCLQLSLLKGLDPTAHLALGRALQPLLDENILVIGSGFSFHNMRAFMWGGTPAADPQNDAFQDWLIETCTTDLPADIREDRLTNWNTAPYARYAHPREEHLLPLHVCAGMAAKPAELIFDNSILGKRAVAFLWQADPNKA